MNPVKNNPTVYSTEVGRVCPRCGNPQSKCTCKKNTKSRSIPKGDGVVRVWLESKGRRGKSVSVITGLNIDEDEMKDLAGELKRLCGTGGTMKEGLIEIQGDHRDALVDALKKRGFNAKRAGG